MDIKDPARFPWHEACLPRPVRQGTGKRGDLRRRQACLCVSARRQVKKVEHYYLSVDALTQPMQVSERPEPYRKG